ncbi:fluoride efflux transporter CrcB [Streptomyces nojiriensis]|uniref:Fluoride-specific ion channel FluC n=1 Tax=Streptomyces nojiriensis TaxID=66374 RepID=A0ABQ3SXJ3_9ACTN|nr:fluoride efflux transporter CrcB [Streptomyces nojiriensis]QTI46384.1 Putative fluoride ion transporter CrcB [Streptomyces nojiriensis]GGR98205.1 putative fluoride ion transporter CrcB 2 [Streptomyces nojiriensis]GHI72863.1 putative fluoride ion transporter CrcB 2 [Streptomyces nojiriensis]
MNWLLVVAGAAVGAPLRYLLDRAVQARHDSLFPWGTFVVNAAACLVLGALAGAALEGAASSRLQLLLGAGLCGALSTYSTFSYETLRLAERGRGFLAAANVVMSVLVGLGAVHLGSQVARRLFG